MFHLNLGTMEFGNKIGVNMDTTITVGLILTVLILYITWQFYKNDYEDFF